MRVVIADRLYLEGFPDKVRAAIRKGCEITNPMFHKMRKMGKPYVHLSEFVRYWQEDRTTGVLAIGIGHEDRLRAYCEDSGLCVEWVDSRSAPPLPSGQSLRSTIKLRPYQEGQPERIVRAGRGICRFDTGYGKTILALRAIELLQTPALVVVPRSNIYEQFKKDIEAYLGFSPAGLDDAGSRPITLVTIQGLQRRAQGPDGFVRRFKDAFGTLVVDEAHTVVPKKSRDCIEGFSARYRLGFTATPKRTDGQGQAIFWIFGPVVAEGTVERASPTVFVLNNPAEYAKDEYFLMVDEQVCDNARRMLVADAATAEARAGRKVLVLTKRVAHYEYLAELISGESETKHLSVIPLSSGGSAKDRASLIAGLRSGVTPFDVLLGTFSLLSTGVDIPSLDTLVIAGDLKSEILTEQSAGRILRLFDGKPQPRIIDVHDTGNGIFRHQGYERQKFYKGQRWPIMHYGRS